MAVGDLEWWGLQTAVVGTDSMVWKHHKQKDTHLELGWCQRARAQGPSLVHSLPSRSSPLFLGQEQRLGIVNTRRVLGESSARRCSRKTAANLPTHPPPLAAAKAGGRGRST